MPARNYIFVSDLHLSEGFLKDEKCYHVNEDFFYDDAFARFLEYLEDTRKGEGYKKPWRLVLNGDFLDFLQVTSAPDEDVFKTFVEGATGTTYDDSVVEISEKERKLGLGFDAPRSVWKLARIMEGHPRFFGALAAFLAAGNELLVIKGNHDAEFTYPEVRDYFRKAVGAGAEAADVSRRVFFSRWFYCEEGLFYAEHGGQYDDSNRYVFFLDPTMVVKGRRLPTLRFPFGSFFVRYFFNRIEERVPFADNLRPRAKAFMWVVTKKTWYAVLECGTLISFAVNFVRKKIFSHFDLLAFLEWLRLKRNIFARTVYLSIFYPLIKWVIRPNAGQYMQYKYRNFRFMFETESTNGIIPENGAPTGKAGPSLLDLLKIYNRSFREGAIAEEREKELADLLRTVLPTETVEVAAAEHMSVSEIINRIVLEASSATRPKPLIRIYIFKYWRLTTTLISAALILWALARWAFGVPGYGLLLLVAAAIAYVLRGLGEEILLRYYDVEPERYLQKAAGGVARVLGVPYVILGHTHVAYIRAIEPDGEEKPKDVNQWEVNTGSWTPVYDEKMVLRRTGDEFPFVQITTEGRGEAELKLLHWNDELGAPQAIRYTGGC
jgi:UDP-2,3-diacylglucosamine pyrophosphatase LpxH